MRKLMWFTLGFCGASALCAYVLWGGDLLLLAVPGACLAALFAMVGRYVKPLGCAAVVLLGCAAGFVWFYQYDGLYLRAASEMDGVTCEAVVRVTDYSYETKYGSAVAGEVTLKGKTYPVRAYLSGKAALSPGDRVRGWFRFRLTTPEGAESSAYHQGRGVFLLLYQDGMAQPEPAEAPSWRDRIAVLRWGIKETLRDNFPEDVQPFVKALLLGDTRDLSYELDTDLKLSGIRHVVSVSGLHISILFAMLETVSLRKRSFMALLGFPALLFFAALVGFSPSVTRACLMSALLLLARLLDREYDGPTALAFAALVMTVCRPLVVTDVGFQLSVGSVAGIYLFSDRIRKWITARLGSTRGKKVKRILVSWFSGSVSVTLGASIVTTPLCAVYFGTVSLVGVLTNLLTLWAISAVFYGIIGVCLLSVLWQTGAAVLAAAVSVLCRFVMKTAGILADFPLAAVYVRSEYIVMWLVFVYLLLVLFALGRAKRPLVLGGCAVMGLCVALLASWTEPMVAETRLTVLDVGQGQCLILQSQGKTFLVDCGGSSDTAPADIAAAELLSQGIGTLDGIVVTHLDDDHAGAVGNLLTRVDTRLLILPPAFSELGEASSGEVVYALEDMTIRFGESKMEIFTASIPAESNENSLCILFDTENCDILITGDRGSLGERILLKRAEIPDVDILIAGHHGSKYATSEELLMTCRPEIVCISAGAGNHYGHPAPETIRRLEQFGCEIYRTDLMGDILIRR